MMSWEVQCKTYYIQECIPVGCVPSAAVAVSRGGEYSPPPVDRHTPVKHNLRNFFADSNYPFQLHRFFSVSEKVVKEH